MVEIITTKLGIIRLGKRLGKPLAVLVRGLLRMVGRLAVSRVASRHTDSHKIDSRQIDSGGGADAQIISARLAGSLLMLVAVSGCGLFGDLEIDTSENTIEQLDNREEGVLGTLSVGLFGDRKTESEGATLGVNAFLWRGALDTISFMPVSTADPFGGVLITDWYQPPESPTERFKINVYILGRQLRADAVRAAVFRQRLHPSGAWIDAPVSPNTDTDLENSILTKARELRIAAVRS